MRRLFLAFVGMLLVATAGCEKDGECLDCIRLQYAQTYCADAWGYGTNGTDAEVGAAIRDFFTSLGMRVEEVSVYANATPELCNACTCKTGKTIYIVTTAARRQSFEAYGFF